MSAGATDTANARAILTLTLAARGLIEIINALGDPWAQLITTLLLAGSTRTGWPDPVSSVRLL